MTFYTDPETGVSFRYPAALKATGGYGDGLSEGGEDGTPAPVERLSVSWSYYEARKDDTGHVFTWYWSTYTFAYALLPERTAKKCAARFELKDDDRYSDPKTVVLNGITFIHVSFSPEPGLGHSGDDDLYTTFHRGRCLGFSLSSDTYHNGDKPTAAQRRQANIPGGPEDTLKAVQLR
jgi:hypothetical protein